MLKEIAIHEIEGVRIGHGENRDAGTGCTVIICPAGGPCGVDVRGGGPASRETELLRPVAAAEVIHAIVLCGGSAFGLDAAGGVMRYLEDRDIGFATSVCKVPLVVASSIFDLVCGSSTVRPDAAMGYAACVHSEENRPQGGNHGVGIGATVGKYGGAATMMKAGLGIAAFQAGDVKVGALVVVNALGDVYGEDGRILAGMLTKEGEFADTVQCMLGDLERSAAVPGGCTTNTTIGAVVTNAALDKTAMNKVAALGSNGIVRAVRPVNTMADGDTLYALSTGGVSGEVNSVGILAAYAVEEAVRRAVRDVAGAYGIPALCDMDR